jgi:hypothetical protein
LRSTLLRPLAGVLLAAGVLTAMPTWGADSDLDALELKSSADEPAQPARAPFKLFVEAAAGDIDRRFGLPSQDLRRASIDFGISTRLGEQWRAVFSNRLDYLEPPEPGKDRALNSVREAYFGWTNEGGTTAFEAGRVNLLHGPAYGYNPTDFFRDGALRAVTTANPFQLRENRMGTVVLRGQGLWPSGSLALTLSPKLDNRPSGETFSLDLGSTNHVDRGLVALNQKWCDRVSGQFLLYKESGLDVQPGASVTALFGQAVVAYAEWSYAREPSLLDRAAGTSNATKSGHRFAGGLTYTTGFKLSLTAEIETNGLALNDSEWRNLVATRPDVALAYLEAASRRQDLPMTRAYFLYLSQRDLAGVKNLELTALLRRSGLDQSQMSWLELRYRWPTVDIAFQLQHHSGDAGTVFGLVPLQRTAQVMGTYRFW